MFNVFIIWEYKIDCLSKWYLLIHSDELNKISWNLIFNFLLSCKRILSINKIN